MDLLIPCILRRSTYANHPTCKIQRSGMSDSKSLRLINICTFTNASYDEASNPISLSSHIAHIESTTAASGRLRFGLMATLTIARPPRARPFQTPMVRLQSLLNRHPADLEPHLFGDSEGSPDNEVVTTLRLVQVGSQRRSAPVVPVLDPLYEVGPVRSATKLEGDVLSSTMATELPEPRLPVEVAEGRSVVVRKQEAEVVFGVVDPFRLSPNCDAGAK